MGNETKEDKSKEFCPRCKELIKITDIICPKCGLKLINESMVSINEDMENPLHGKAHNEEKSNKEMAGDENSLLGAEKEGLRGQNEDIGKRKIVTAENMKEIGDKEIKKILRDKIEGKNKRKSNFVGNLNEGNVEIIQVDISKDGSCAIKDTISENKDNVDLKSIKESAKESISEDNFKINRSDPGSDQKISLDIDKYGKDIDEAKNGQEIQTLADQRKMKTILKNKSHRCKICLNEALANDVNNLYISSGFKNNWKQIVDTINNKYNNDPQFKIHDDQVARHFRLHYIVKDFSSPLISIQDGIPINSISDDGMDDLINNPTNDIDYVRKQKKVLAIKMRRLHGILSWIEQIEEQTFVMSDENVNGEINALNVPRDFYAMSSFAGTLENDVIDTLEKLDKKIKGKQVDFLDVQNCFIKMRDRIDELCEELGYDNNNEIMKKFKEDMSSFADEIRWQT